MFYCFLHGWTSIDGPCPACHPVTITTTSDYVLNGDDEDDLKIFDTEFPKQQIEKLTAQYQQMSEHLRKQKYTQEQYDKAIEDAFNAARTYIPKYKDEKAKEPSLFSLYETSQDYINHINKQKQ